ncbi:MAG: hypothetical protein AAFY45_19345 [Bacteroidota bacterium]
MIKRISYPEFTNLYKSDKAILVHFYEEGNPDSLRLKRHLDRYIKSRKADISVLHLQVGEHRSIADFLGKEREAGLYLIKEQRCVREFKLSPISYHLFEYLIEQYAHTGEQLPYAV